MTSAIPQQLDPRCFLMFWPRTSQSPSLTLGCTLQFLIFCTFADSECLLLAVIVYDWHKAIINPLLYTDSTSNRVCSLLMVGVYMEGMADSLIHKTLTFHLCFCASNEINHFFLWYPSSSVVVLLRFTDQWVSNICLFFGFIELSFISRVLISYCYIILSILKIHLDKRIFKAFFTWTSHLAMVAIFQGTLLFMYFRHSFSYTLNQVKITSLFYKLMIPMLNPLIYSLWSKELKKKIEKLKSKRWFKYIMHMHTHIVIIFYKIIWYGTQEA